MWLTGLSRRPAVNMAGAIRDTHTHTHKHILGTHVSSLGDVTTQRQKREKNVHVLRSKFSNDSMQWPILWL